MSVVYRDRAVLRILAWWRPGGRRKDSRSGYEAASGARASALRAWVVFAVLSQFEAAQQIIDGSALAGEDLYGSGQVVDRHELRDVVYFPSFEGHRPRELPVEHGLAVANLNGDPLANGPAYLNCRRIRRIDVREQLAQPYLFIVG